MGLFSIDAVESFLKDKKYDFFHAVVFRESDGTIILYVNKTLISERVHKGKTSERQLANIKKSVADFFSSNVEIIHSKGHEHHDLESGFHQILNHKFDGRVISLFISFRDDTLIDAIIEFIDPSEEIMQELETTLSSLSDDTDLNLNTLTWLESPYSLPSNPEILRAIKVNQPITSEALRGCLSSRHPAVTVEWLNKKLDLLRKKEFIIRQTANAEFVTTMKALSVIPAGKHTTSSDIARVLALGVMKW